MFQGGGTRWAERGFFHLGYVSKKGGGEKKNGDIKVIYLNVHHRQSMSKKVT